MCYSKKGWIGQKTISHHCSFKLRKYRQAPFTTETTRKKCFKSTKTSFLYLFVKIKNCRDIFLVYFGNCFGRDLCYVLWGNVSSFMRVRDIKRSPLFYCCKIPARFFVISRKKGGKNVSGVAGWNTLRACEENPRKLPGWKSPNFGGWSQVLTYCRIGI